MSDINSRLRTVNSQVESRDPALAEELRAVREQGAILPPTASSMIINETAIEGADNAGLFVQETIVLRVGRPVLAIVNDTAKLDFKDAESVVWRRRLMDARDQLVHAAKAVGRIEVQHHPIFEWIGTGWLVAKDVLVTNRHVAREFGERKGEQFVFKMGSSHQKITASVDFLKEVENKQTLELALHDILHIEDESGPDLAFLRVEPKNGMRFAEPIRLDSKPAKAGQLVAVIGYPARDSRIPDQALMLDIFGDIYDRKRLAPGRILSDNAGKVQHDCSTLGGNSGSVVLDLESGKAVGLHFAGRFLQANYAVPIRVISEKLQSLSGRSPKAASSAGFKSISSEQHAAVPLRGTVTSETTTITIPIKLSLGLDLSGFAPAPRQPRLLARGEDITIETGEEDLAITESRPADYADRAGYDRHFLSKRIEVLLPTIELHRDDVLTFKLNGKTQSELRYEHFSVVMSASRRMCLFSAVNIDGEKSRKVKRTGWRTDPRIPASAQIMHECYGNSPKFSRGHMTRREDPVWGSKGDAVRGNADSMHVTNTVPQMQPFNAPIWLGLEDYALDHAREDDMRISVFTGPFLLPDDPDFYGVHVPRSFWKIIAFVHDQTGKLCATGYSMSQEAYLCEEEYVFGQHKTSQIAISSIEEKAGLSFGKLSESDPYRAIEEARPRALTDYRQIRFY